MDANKLLSLLGREALDQELLELLRQDDIDLGSELRLPKGEYTAYIERQNMGVCLVFSDEAMFKGINKQSIGLGPLYLSGIFFYADGKDGYDQYIGWLPNNISFDQTSIELNELLGQAEWFRERNDGSLAAERWFIGEFKIHITYHNSRLTPSVISISKPDSQE